MGSGQEDCTAKLSSHGCRFIGQRGGRVVGGGGSRNGLQVEALQLFVVDLIRFGKLEVGSGVRDRSFFSINIKTIKKQEFVTFYRAIQRRDRHKVIWCAVLFLSQL